MNVVRVIPLFVHTDDLRVRAWFTVVKNLAEIDLTESCLSTDAYAAFPSWSKSPPFAFETGGDYLDKEVNYFDLSRYYNFQQEQSTAQRHCMPIAPFMSRSLQNTNINILTGGCIGQLLQRWAHDNYGPQQCGRKANYLAQLNDNRLCIQCRKCNIHAREDEQHNLTNKYLILTQGDKFSSVPSINAVRYKLLEHCKEPVDPHNAIK